MYEKLFQPIKIGTLEIKNRFLMPAMNSNLSGEDHCFTEQACRYYAERAKGGFGLLITEFICVSEEGLAGSKQAAIYDDRFIPSLKMLTERVHENGGKIFAQLQHAGRRQKPGVTELEPVGASWIPDANSGRKIHELTVDEIQVLIQKFADGAARAKEAGFDGVEIHGAHGYLLADFLSRAVNKRVDRYGGNEVNRARIVCEIIQKVKETCGADYPVSVRSSGEEGFDGGNTIEEAMAHAMLFEQAGADMLNVSYGTAIRSYYTRPAFNMDNVKKIKSIVNIPVAGVGRINDPAMALAAVTSGSMDLVALGRQSICDSHFPEKVREGRIEELFTCTGCMQRCLYKQFFEEGFGVSCMINPFSGKEGLWEIKEAEEKKKIGIVGAGPAGLQAAWILAAKGHKVTVYEKDAWPGGQYRLACIPAMKQDLGRTVTTYMTLGKKYGVQYKFQTKADAELLKAENPDVVILAAGSLPVVPRIPGIDGEGVCLAQDVLRCDVLPQEKNILVLGAGLVGAETAEFLSARNHQVTLVDMLQEVAPLAPQRVRMDLIERLKENQVQFVLESKVLEILPDGVRIERDQQEQTLTGYGRIVLAFGARANQTLSQKLEGAFDTVYRIGDAERAGDAKKAIFEATKLALEL